MLQQNVRTGNNKVLQLFELFYLQFLLIPGTSDLKYKKDYNTRVHQHIFLHDYLLEI